MDSEFGAMMDSLSSGLESKLQTVLKPVKPDPVFVDALKFKLTQTPSIVLESGRKHIELLALGAGLAIGLAAYLIFRKFNSKD